MVAIRDSYTYRDVLGCNIAQPGLYSQTQRLDHSLTRMEWAYCNSPNLTYSKWWQHLNLSENLQLSLIEECLYPDLLLKPSLSQTPFSDQTRLIYQSHQGRPWILNKGDYLLPWKRMKWLFDLSSEIPAILNTLGWLDLNRLIEYPLLKGLRNGWTNTLNSLEKATSPVQF